MSHITRGAHKPLFSSVAARFADSSLAFCSSQHPYLYVDGMYAGSSRSVSSVSLSSVGFRAGPWERALLALPDKLLSALRAGELDDPGVLCDYPRMTTEELYAWLGEKLGEDVALSGATSQAQLSTTSCGSGTAMPLSLTVPPGSTSTATNLDGMVDSVVSAGGDPKNRPCILDGRRPKNRPRILDKRRPKN